MSSSKFFLPLVSAIFTVALLGCAGHQQGYSAAGACEPPAATAFMLKNAEDTRYNQPYEITQGEVAVSRPAAPTEDTRYNQPYEITQGEVAVNRPVAPVEEERLNQPYAISQGDPAYLPLVESLRASRAASLLR